MAPSSQARLKTASSKLSASTTKHIFVTGGVVSSLGKGVSAASIGRLLKNMGYSVAIQKLDPYLNVDPGTMNPFQHGEVFVTEDGAECDLDLGHYERFLNQPCSQHSTYTSGQIYQSVLSKERAGVYNGGTVQVIPHITNEIRQAINAFEELGVDVVIHEIGGTVGDIEGLPFVEAVRQFRHACGRANVILCHVAYIPYIKAAGEIKTKPAQHSVQKLRELGLMPDFLLCRTEHKLRREVRDKLALFCNVDEEHVIEMIDCATTIYEVPQILQKQQVHSLIVKRLGLEDRDLDMRKWDLMVRHIKNPKDTVRIGLVGKYVDHQDAYRSVTESIDHAAWANIVEADIISIEGEDLEKDNWQELLQDLDGVVVPGGFGKRGFEGKLRAIQYCRENHIPYLGLCLGMQAAAVEIARNVIGLEGANSVEMDPKSPHPIIILMEEQQAVTDLGATMRLGAYPCTIVKKTSRTGRAYGGEEVVMERHRHRFEFNPAYESAFEQAGVQFTGLYIPDPEKPDAHLVEMLELRDHPFFVATQAHPEFQSSPVNPHPLFKALLAVVRKNKA